MKLHSDAFKHTANIPAQYTCEGQDVSPALSWHDEPEATQTYALIAEDPDAPTGVWTHWVVYNIPADIHELPHGVPHIETVAEGILQGRNDFGRIGYGGPCPPKGDRPHRYYFRLFALDGALALEPGAGKKDVEDAMQGKILAQANLEGLYSRH